MSMSDMAQMSSHQPGSAEKLSQDEIHCYAGKTGFVRRVADIYLDCAERVEWADEIGSGNCFLVSFASWAQRGRGTALREASLGRAVSVFPQNAATDRSRISGSPTS